MNKKILKTLFATTTAFLSLSTVAIIATTSTSCKSVQQRNAAITLFNKYNHEIEEKMGNSRYPTEKNASDILEIMKKYAKLANLLVIGSKVKSVDEQIWAETIKYQIGTDINSITSKSYLLGAPVGGDICTSYDFFLDSSYSKATEYIDSNKDFNNWNDLLTKTITTLNNVAENFKTGIKQNVSISGMMVKMLISKAFKSLYSSQLENYLQKGTAAPKIDNSNWKNILGSCDSFSNLVSNIKPGVIKQESISILTKLAKKLDNNIDEWMNFMLSEYWPNVNYGWSEDKIENFELKVIDKNKSDEVTNGYEVSISEPNTIHGLGLTEINLKTKDIGIGFMKNNAQKIGLNIYKYIIRKDTTLEKTAKEINETGQNLVSSIFNNMKGVANYLANKLTTNKENEWKPKGFTYDNNIFAGTGPVEFKDTIATRNDKTWNINMENFFKWLNSEQWYFGRDVLNNQYVMMPKEITGLSKDTYYKPNSKVATPISIDKVSPVSSYSANPKYIDYLGSAKVSNLTSNKFGDAGDIYKKWVINQTGIKPGVIGDKTINGQQAYAGATFAMDTYTRWRNAVYPTVQTIFSKSKNSSVFAPDKLILNTKIVTGIGGAAYANDDIFYLDVNPYYGLQKWSMTTLASHESLPGHNLQMIYAIDNTSDKENSPQLSYTSYAEGWGVFSEWIVTQYGSYGKPSFVNDWLNQSQRLLLPDFDNNNFSTKNKNFSTVNINIIEANKNTINGKFSNGIYETDFDGFAQEGKVTSDKLDQGYFNAMQYFGFLNERQLRAMRLVLDTSIHAGGPKIDEQGKIKDKSVTCDGTKGSGWSLRDEVNFMHANSALGQGDSLRESQRYLNYVGQATSYMIGENVVEGLFANASWAYAKKHNNALFLDYTNVESTRNNTAPFFNLFLRNNDIPLQVLIKFVNQYIKSNIGELPPNGIK